MVGLTLVWRRLLIWTGHSRTIAACICYSFDLYATRRYHWLVSLQSVVNLIFIELMFYLLNFAWLSKDKPHDVSPSFPSWDHKFQHILTIMSCYKNKLHKQYESRIISKNNNIWITTKATHTDISPTSIFNDFDYRECSISYLRLQLKSAQLTTFFTSGVN